MENIWQGAPVIDTPGKGDPDAWAPSSVCVTFSRYCLWLAADIRAPGAGLKPKSIP